MSRLIFPGFRLYRANLGGYALYTTGSMHMMAVITRQGTGWTVRPWDNRPWMPDPADGPGRFPTLAQAAQTTYDERPK